MKKYLFWLILFLCVNCAISVTESNIIVSSNQSENQAQNKIIQSLKVNLPDLQIDQVNKTNITQIYEVTSGHKVFYVDQNGKYILLGNLVDLDTKKIITQERVEELSVFNWSQLPLNIALRQKLGTGQNKIAVFTDPDCPFCQNLEKTTIAKLNNVTVYYFLYPLDIHPNASDDAKKILCSQIPEQTFLDWMVDGKSLPKKTNCINSGLLAQMKYVAESLVKVEATPTILLEDGTLLPGLVPADYLNKLIMEASYKVKNKESGIKSLNTNTESKVK